MTDQELFDKVLAHCRKQGVASRGDDGCMYRGDGGLSCAAGCVILDEHYNPAIEGRGLEKMIRLDKRGLLHGPDLLLKEALVKSGVGPDQWEILDLMQDAHDSHMPRELGGSMEEFELAMRWEAERLGLKYTEPDQPGEQA